MFSEELLICLQDLPAKHLRNCDMKGKVKRFNLKIRGFSSAVAEDECGGIVFRFLSDFVYPPIYFCFQGNQINPTKQPGLQACFR